MSDAGERPIRPRQADHASEVQLGGATAPASTPAKRPRRSPQLRVLERSIDSPVQWDAKPGLPPGGRDECRNGERPCPYVRCKWHLWLIDGADAPGRPRGGKRPSILLPAWLEYPTPACCALDVAEVVEASRNRLNRANPVQRTAEAMHSSSNLIQRIVARALSKLRANDVDLRHLIPDEP